MPMQTRDTKIYESALLLKPISLLRPIILLFFIFCASSMVAQPATISGRAFDRDNPNLPLPKMMVINKRTGQGVFADAESKFSISATQADTLLFSIIGYNTKKVCLKDSVLRKHYYIEIEMHKLQYTLKEVSVFAPRSLNDIDKDIARLDSTRRARYYTDVNAFSSPITYLYERFSKFGKSKQQVAEWENEDLKKDILKDLFRLYVRHEIIDLSEEEFEAFISYCNLSEEFIKNASQFELVMAIKGKFESFNANKDYYMPHEKRW
jgi:hypothetical protein